jgi:hypothetical protein
MFERRQSAFVAVLLLLIGWSVPRALHGQDVANDDAKAVEEAREALRGAARFPWYDRSEDDVRRLEVKPRGDADSENRGSKWTNTKATTTTRMPRMSFFGPALQWVGITALVLLLGLIAFLVAKAFLKDETSETITLRKVVETHRDVDRVEALPFQVKKPTGDFLSEARRLYEAGQYSEAIVYLFSYQLVQLDKHHLIRLTKGKTNRQYVREVRQRPGLRATLELTMIAFEDAFFGRKSLSRDRFDACWQRLDEFHGELERLERAAA